MDEGTPFAIQFASGINREKTRLASQSHWYDGDHVRWKDGKAEWMRGYVKHNDTQFDGTARDTHVWSDNSSNRLIGFGTEKKLYVEFQSTIYDITPLVSVASFVSAVGTTLDSTTVSISAAAHNLEGGDFVLIADADATEGITLSGVYEVVTATDLNNFTIDSGVTATGTSTSGGGTLSVSYLLPTGNAVAIQGLGWGAGPWQAGASTTGERAWNEAASASDITFAADQWSFDNWGEDLVANRRGGRIYVWDADGSTTPQRATLVTASPSTVNSILVSPTDQHLIAFGSTDITGTFSNLLVRWCDQSNYNNWTPSISSTAGEKLLTDGTVIRGALRSKNQINIWTDRSMHAMRYIGRPFIFDIKQVGTKCGLIGQHASVDMDGISYWMSDTAFYVYDGRVRKLDCPVQKYIFGRLTQSQKNKIYAGVNTEFGEVMWLYPSRSSTECNSYVIYNTEENAWYYGSGMWTVISDKDILDEKLAFGSDGYMYDNEPEGIYTGDGANISAYLESGDFDIDEGKDVIRINKFVPDADIENGTVTLTIKTLEYPNGTITTKGPYSINSMTQKIDLVARGRQGRIRVSSSDNVFFREGHMRMWGNLDGER